MIKMVQRIGQIFDHRELLLNLAVREIKVKYKQSVFGIMWVILQPLTMMLIFTVIFSHFAKIPSDGIPYPIFSLAALVPWMFFSSALSSGISSVVANVSLVTKIYFPREVFPFAYVLSALFDFLVTFVIFAGIMIFYKTPITINILYIILIFFYNTFQYPLHVFTSCFWMIISPMFTKPKE